MLFFVRCVSFCYSLSDYCFSAQKSENVVIGGIPEQNTVQLLIATTSKSVDSIVQVKSVVVSCMSYKM